jgi:hypothetical protein
LNVHVVVETWLVWRLTESTWLTLHLHVHALVESWLTWLAWLSLS